MNEVNSDLRQHFLKAFSKKEKAMEATGKFTPSPNDGSRNLTRTVDQASSGAHDVINKVSDAARPAVDRIA